MIIKYSQTPVLNNLDELNSFFGYPLDYFQIQSIDAINKNYNLLATAHTGAGKSTIAEYCIYKYNKVIYTSPIKTLSNQKYSDFVKTWGVDKVGILTGDIKINENANIIIMTTEVLRNTIFQKNDFLKDVSCVIFDEAHYINDPNRGFVWEECITNLDKSIQLILLSATFVNDFDFCKWIEKIKERDVAIVGTTYRPVPLKFYGFNKKEYYIMNDKKEINQNTLKEFYDSYKLKNPNEKQKNYSKKFIINEFIKYIDTNNKFPLLFFIFSRKKCEEYAKSVELNLLNKDEQSEIDRIYKTIFRENIAFMRDKNYLIELKSLIDKGIAFHHSGLLPVLKEFVEILFSKGLIKILFATETFAVGVNMPTKTVCFPELEKYENGLRFLRNDEFIQMSGRAGRRGKDIEGFVYYLPISEVLPEQSLKSIYLGKGREISSKIILKPSRFINYIDNNNFLENTLFNIELYNNINALKEQIKNLENNFQNLYQMNEEDEINFQNYIQLKNINKPSKKIIQQIKNIEQNFTKEMNLNLKILEKNIDNNNQIEIYKNKLNSVINLCNDIYYEGINIINHFIKTPQEKDVIKLLDYENEFLLYKLIINRNNYSAKEFVILLSLFLEEKSSVFFKDIENIINDKEFIVKIKDILIIHNNLLNEADGLQNPYFNIYRDTLHMDLIIPLYYWIDGASLDEINFYYEGYSGNFVRMVFQIKEMLEKILSIIEKFEDYEYINLLIEIKNKLIREETVFYSIYLNN